MTQKSRPLRNPRPVRAVPILSGSETDSNDDGKRDESLTEGENLQEAEREIGINEWLDAETGEPAEGQSPPHLAQE